MSYADRAWDIRLKTSLYLRLILLLLRHRPTQVDHQAVQEVPEYLIPSLQVFRVILRAEESTDFRGGHVKIHQGHDLNDVRIAQLQGHPQFLQDVVIGHRAERSQFPNGAPLGEWPLDPILVLEHESHHQVSHYVQAGSYEAQVDEAQAHLLSLDIELMRPPFADAIGLALEVGFDAVDHRACVPGCRD